MSRTIHIVALGCPKNRVDTERMLGLAAKLGLKLVQDPAEAEIIVVNTCGFILPAKEESINTVLELAEHKAGRCQELVMAGCLAQRYGEDLARDLPEVDHFIGTADLPRLAEILAGDDLPRISVGDPTGQEETRFERALVGSPHSAYLKISEGCDRQCSFCIIPRLRGRQRSREVDSLRAEAEELAASGVKELIIVAQDSTAYGRDLPGGPGLAQLLEVLSEIQDLRWIRLLYTYPSAIDEPLIQALARLPRVIPYLDLPLQHVDDGVLKAMRRGYKGAEVSRLLTQLRAELAPLFLRGTIIAGHPGETADAHQRMLDFVASERFDHLGVFPYSEEEGTHAAELPGKVPEELIQQRVQELMLRQQEISREKLHQLQGQQLEVLVDGPSPESEYLMEGRHAGQAPEVDGVVIITDCDARPGQFVQARVTDSADYDLVASQISPKASDAS